MENESTEEPKTQPRKEKNVASQEPKTQPRKPKKNSNFLIVAITIGICILIYSLAQFVFKSNSSSSQNSSQEFYSVTLVCADCAAEGININVWQYAGQSRGEVMFSAPHGTIVSVLDSKTADDGRTWYKVKYQGKSGWIAQDFVKR